MSLPIYPNFPKKGVNFVDIFPLFNNGEALKNVFERLQILCGVNIAAIEARGFLFVAPLLMYGRKFIPVRKGGKLPFVIDDIVSVKIKKEYGEDVLEFRYSDIDECNKQNNIIPITILDDVLATGGTAYELARALEKVKVNGCKVKVDRFVFPVEIQSLGGRKLLERIANVHSFLKY